ncbi:25179_t:CDS:2, partial [Dentiscutata erythropus]
MDLVIIILFIDLLGYEVFLIVFVSGCVLVGKEDVVSSLFELVSASFAIFVSLRQVLVRIYGLLVVKELVIVEVLFINDKSSFLLALELVGESLVADGVLFTNIGSSFLVLALTLAAIFSAILLLHLIFHFSMKYLQSSTMTFGFVLLWSCLLRLEILEYSSDLRQALQDRIEIFPSLLAYFTIRNLPVMMITFPSSNLESLNSS